MGGGPVSVDVFVLRKPGDCTVSLTFRVAGGDGFTGTYVGETGPWTGTYIGNAEDGIWMGFDPWDLPNGSGHLVTVQYMTYGTSSPCSWLRVEPHPDFGAVWIYDCNTEMNYDVTADSAVRRIWVNGVVTYCATCSPTPVGTGAEHVGAREGAVRLASQVVSVLLVPHVIRADSSSQDIFGNARSVGDSVPRWDRLPIPAQVLVC
jgi:hypothetical protein